MAAEPASSGLRDFGNSAVAVVSGFTTGSAAGGSGASAGTLVATAAGRPEFSSRSRFAVRFAAAASILASCSLACAHAMPSTSTPLSDPSRFEPSRIGQNRPAIDLTELPRPQHGARVRSAPSKRIGQRFRRAAQERANAVRPGWKRRRPFLPQRLELFGRILITALRFVLVRHCLDPSCVPQAAAQHSAASWRLVARRQADLRRAGRHRHGSTRAAPTTGPPSATRRRQDAARCAAAKAVNDDWRGGRLAAIEKPARHCQDISHEEPDALTARPYRRGAEQGGQRGDPKPPESARKQGY